MSFIARTFHFNRHNFIIFRNQKINFVIAPATLFRTNRSTNTCAITTCEIAFVNQILRKSVIIQLVPMRTQDLCNHILINVPKIRLQLTAQQSRVNIIARKRLILKSQRNKQSSIRKKKLKFSQILILSHSCRRVRSVIRNENGSGIL